MAEGTRRDESKRSPKVRGLITANPKSSPKRADIENRIERRKEEPVNERSRAAVTKSDLPEAPQKGPTGPETSGEKSGRSSAAKDYRRAAAEFTRTPLSTVPPAKII